MTTRKKKPALRKAKTRKPGTPGEAHLIDRILRVDQAGEYGAKRIYEGQLAILGNSPSGPVIREMAEQEEEHLAAFNRLVAERKARPTVLQPLWHVAGFALGAGTALLGEKAAMAATVAVEEVIVDHYTRQAQGLGSKDPELRRLIEKFRDDEDGHRETGLAHEAASLPYYPLLRRLIRAGAKTAIWLSERV